MNKNTDPSPQKSDTTDAKLSWWWRRRAERKARGAIPSRLRQAIGRTVRVVIAVLATGVALFLAGIGFLYYQGKRRPAGNGQYVALGSSFAAGPGVGQRDPNSPMLCIRSAQNYGHLLAKARDLNLTDVTCSGATTQNILEGGQFFQPPQVDALCPNTELVTVTIGGNDVSYLGNLIAWSSQQDPDRMPFLGRLLASTPTPEAEVDRELALLPDRLARIATEVRRRSPRALLVFVDYTTVLPEVGSCPDRLPIPEQQLQRSRYVARQLADITAAVARDCGALLVRASEVTRGHDICSADPWVFGFDFAATPFAYGSMAYHPTEKAMRAIAEAINEVLPLLLG
ncbi:MAG: SGNH/GDSL hydrolase family protein [Ktedonobacteraceae bacterium]